MVFFCLFFVFNNKTTTTTTTTTKKPLIDIYMSDALVVPIAQQRNTAKKYLTPSEVVKYNFDGPFDCIACGYEVFLRRPDGKRPHFVHKSHPDRPDHTSANDETIEHIYAKRLLSLYHKTITFSIVCYECKRVEIALQSFLKTSHATEEYALTLNGKRFQIDVVYFSGNVIDCLLEVENTHKTETPKWIDLVTHFPFVFELKALDIIRFLHEKDDSLETKVKLLCWMYGTYCTQCQQTLFTNCDICSHSSLIENMEETHHSKHICSNCFQDTKKCLLCTDCHMWCKKPPTQDANVCDACFNACPLCLQHTDRNLHRPCIYCFKLCMCETSIPIEDIACQTCLRSCRKCKKKTAGKDLCDDCAKCSRCQIVTNSLTSNLWLCQQCVLQDKKKTSLLHNAPTMLLPQAAAKKPTLTPTTKPKDALVLTVKQLEAPKITVEVVKPKTVFKSDVRICKTCKLKPQLYWQYEECEDCSRSKCRAHAEQSRRNSQ